MTEMTIMQKIEEEIKNNRHFFSNDKNEKDFIMKIKNIMSENRNIYFKEIIKDYFTEDEIKRNIDLISEYENVSLDFINKLMSLYLKKDLSCVVSFDNYKMSIDNDKIILFKDNRRYEILISLRMKIQMAKIKTTVYTINYLHDNNIKKIHFNPLKNQKKIEYNLEKIGKVIKRKELIYENEVKYKTFILLPEKIEIVFVDLDFYKRNKDKLSREFIKQKDDYENPFNLNMQCLEENKYIYSLIDKIDEKQIETLIKINNNI